MSCGTSIRSFSVDCSGNCSESPIPFDCLYDPSNPKGLELSCCDFFLFLSRMNITHRHLDAGVPQHCRERREIHATGDGAGRKCVAQVVKPKVIPPLAYARKKARPRRFY